MGGYVTKAIFSALDKVKIQLEHFKAIIIAGMGFFTDAYHLFCIIAITKLLGRLYYYNPDVNHPGKLPDNNVNNAITVIALCGTLVGQLFFGWLGDRIGRKKVYGISLATMVVCALASGISFGSSAKSVVCTLCFFRFWLGFGIGADYPLSAVIMCEYANQKTRGAYIAAVFAMQGMGILFAGAVPTIVSKLFLIACKAPGFNENQILSTQLEADFAWRIVLMIGAFPAALTYYWRMKMPEIVRYNATAVEGNHEKVIADMERVLDVEETSGFIPSYAFFSLEFFRRHGIHLLGTTSTWFLLDFVFYSLILAQKDIYPASGFISKASNMNALEEMFHISKAMTIIALVFIVPGYWFTVFLIDKIGRYIIQLGGFLLMSIFMAILGIHQYKNLMIREEEEEAYKNCTLFVVLFGLTLFFANFGPNSTTFIVPAELFPARFRSTCHGISAAAGKAGAIAGACIIQYYTIDGNSRDIKKAIIGLSVVNLVGFFCSFLVPETKGRTLEEISRKIDDLQDGGNYN